MTPPGTAGGPADVGTDDPHLVLQHGLVLQRQFSSQPGEAAPVVAAPGLGLAFPAPARPVQPEALVLGREQEEQEETPILEVG